MTQRCYQISCVINLVFGFIKCFFAMQRCNQECFVTKKQVLHIKINGNFFLHDNQFVQPLSPNSRMPQDCSIATKKLQSITILSWKSFEPDAWLTQLKDKKSPQDRFGLEPFLTQAKDSVVMLTTNLGIFCFVQWSQRNCCGHTTLITIHMTCQ